MIFDDGKYRNEASRAVHGFLTRDGIHPAELRRIAREQLARYEVEYRCLHINSARHIDAGFEVTLDDGSLLECRKLLLATGVTDHIPEVEGMRRFYGAGVFHCPYCDGWEVRDRPLAAYGKSAAGLAASLKTWSADVILCTDGPATSKPDESRTAGAPRHPRLPAEARPRRRRRNPRPDRLRRRTVLPCRGIFFNTGQTQRCDLAANLGCAFTKKGAVRTGKLEGTNIPGLFVAGDASKDVQFAIVAAAEGAKAAIAINTALQLEDAR